MQLRILLATYSSLCFVPFPAKVLIYVNNNNKNIEHLTVFISLYVSNNNMLIVTLQFNNKMLFGMAVQQHVAVSMFL